MSTWYLEKVFVELQIQVSFNLKLRLVRLPDLFKFPESVWHDAIVVQDPVPTSINRLIETWNLQTDIHHQKLFCYIITFSLKSLSIVCDSSIPPTSKCSVLTSVCKANTCFLILVVCVRVSPPHLVAGGIAVSIRVTRVHGHHLAISLKFNYSWFA